MAINFAAASTAGLNNPGTEIITLVKDGSGNFINPPSYDKMREYLRSGEVPCLFVTTEGGETGSFYQFVDYSETENKIRFGNDVNAIEFSAGAVAPAVSNVVPKPLTYDYMPEGYPRKAVQTTTLMEEQEVAFTENNRGYIAVLASGLSLVEGQTYAVNWDGTEYDCLSHKVNNSLVIGNLSIFGSGENSGEPFLYLMSGKFFATLDTSSSHTISVKTTEEVTTPMVDEFLPAIPADKLPAIPADKLPAIPADKLEFPIVTLDKRLTDGITTSSPPNYNFTNFTFDELYDAVSKGFILIQDTSTATYMPFLSEIFNGNIFLNIIINADLNQFLVNLLCSNGNTYFSINGIKKITTSEI